MRCSRVRMPALLCLLAVLTCGASLFGVPAVRGDELSDAQAHQRELIQRIEQQRHTLERLDAAQVDLRAALDKTAGSLSEINADLGAVHAEVEATRTDLASAQARYDGLIADLGHFDWTLNVFGAEITESRADLAARRELLGRRLAEAYQIQQTSLLQQALTSDSFVDALANSSAYLELGRQDAELAVGITRDEVTLSTLERNTDIFRYRTNQVRLEVGRRAAALVAQNERLQKQEAELAALEKKTREMQRAQLAEFKRLARTKARAEALLKSQVEGQARLRRAISQIIDTQFHAGQIPSQDNGTLQWPIIGQVTQEFGCTGLEWEPPLEDCEHFHRGIDLVGAEDAAVGAAGDGVVLFVGYNPYDEGGEQAWIVLVAHSAHLITWYAHLQPIAPADVYPGAKVKAGQTLGLQGSTGRSSGPHLHWGVQLDGTFLDPRLFL